MGGDPIGTDCGCSRCARERASTDDRRAQEQAELIALTFKRRRKTEDETTEAAYRRYRAIALQSKSFNLSFEDFARTYRQYRDETLASMPPPMATFGPYRDSRFDPSDSPPSYVRITAEDLTPPSDDPPTAAQIGRATAEKKLEGMAAILLVLFLLPWAWLIQPVHRGDRPCRWRWMSLALANLLLWQALAMWQGVTASGMVETIWALLVPRMGVPDSLSGALVGGLIFVLCTVLVWAIIRVIFPSRLDR